MIKTTTLLDHQEHPLEAWREQQVQKVRAEKCAHYQMALEQSQRMARQLEQEWQDAMYVVDQISAEAKGLRDNPAYITAQQRCRWLRQRYLQAQNQVILDQERLEYYS